MTIGLLPVYDARQSFYGKAYVKITDKGDEYLFSYDTLVAAVKGNQCYCNGLYSQTTTRHIKEFFRQEVGKIFTNKELKELPDIDENDIKIMYDL